MRRDLRLRLAVEADKAERLLLPLAYAQGNGLPWEDIWPRLVEALSPGSGYGNDDLIWLRRTAGSYAVEGFLTADRRTGCITRPLPSISSPTAIGSPTNARSPTP